MTPNDRDVERLAKVVGDAVLECANVSGKQWVVLFARELLKRGVELKKPRIRQGVEFMGWAHHVGPEMMERFISENSDVYYDTPAKFELVNGKWTVVEVEGEVET